MVISFISKALQVELPKKTPKFLKVLIPYSEINIGSFWEVYVS